MSAMLEASLQTTRKLVFLSGVETLARLLLVRAQLDARAGLTTGTMVSGYPGSPLGGFDFALEAQGPALAEHRIHHQPGVNEELAVAVAWGSQMGKAVPYRDVDGVAGVWYGKTPGLDRCGDALRHANAMGSGPNGGLVLFCGDDATAKSSTLPCESQYAFADQCIPVIYPGSQQEVLDLGVHAFRLSRFAGCIVGMKIVTAVADGTSTLDLDLDRHADPVLPAVLIDGVPWQHTPLATLGPHQVPQQELLVVRNRLAAAQAYVRANGLDRIEGGASGARIGIVCAGKTYHDLAQALIDLGIDGAALADGGVRILKLAMTYPLVEETALEFAASVDQLLVIEEKRPFIEDQLRAILHAAGMITPIQGKHDRARAPLVPLTGELGSDDIVDVLTRVLPEWHNRRPAVPSVAASSLTIPPRPPAYCSGCPHNRSTVVPEGQLAGGGVGCHGIMYFEARQAGVQKLPPPPMGAEGVPWIGLAPFVATPHLLQNLGDGTLSHSGLLAIRASVAARVNTTYKILYNGAVAMTGGQHAEGVMDVPALTRELEAEGVARVVVCAAEPERYGEQARFAPGVEVRPRGRLGETQEELAKLPGVTVIIYDQQCATEARRLRKRGLQDTPPARVVINPSVCENCGDCVVKSNCASVQPRLTEFGPKKRIDELTCNRDYTCVEGDCPSFVTITPRPGGKPLPPRPSAQRPTLPYGTLPKPKVAPVEDQFGIYFTGIGGTGVVTAARTLAAAAEQAGFQALGMDQTGLAQKGGAVVSHLRIARTAEALGASAIGVGGADLYLSGDLFQAARPMHLDRLKPGSSVAAIEADLTPTASMLQVGLAAPETAELEREIRARLTGGQAILVPSKRIADQVFGDAVLANMVLLGAACQLGGLPFTIADFERALGSGERAERNRAAFEWGRWAAHDPVAVEKALGGGDRAGAPEEGNAFAPSAEAVRSAERLVGQAGVPEPLVPLVTRRTAQVIDYQNARLARRYLDLIAKSAVSDSADRDWALTRAVAESWYKLLTYKDEYEVARLHLATDYEAVARELGIETEYDLRFHLHPMLFRRLGLQHKVAMGRPFAAAFHVLKRLKGLRGTPFDLFGWDSDHRLERAVIGEYEQALTQGLATLPYDEAVQLAQSALEVRGYGPVKARMVAAWRAHVDGWLTRKAEAA